MRPAGPIELGRVECCECPLGRASGADQGQFCPFITHHQAGGEFLCRAGDPAGHVWYVAEGVIGLSRPHTEPDDVEWLRLPGSFVGLEALSRGTYLYTARSLSRTTLCRATREGLEEWLRWGESRGRAVAEAAGDDPLLADRVSALSGGSTRP
jgi:CRP-like cAMP-binding protein